MRSIRRDIGFGLSLTVVLTGLIAGFFYYVFVVDRAEEALEERAEQAKDGLAGAVTAHLWTFDTHQIEHICQTAMQAEEVAGLKIVDEKGEVVFSSGPLTGPDLISLNTNLSHDEHAVGRLDVAISRHGVKSAQKNILTTMLIVTLCVVGSVLLIMQFLLRRFLSHPMTRLKNDVERLAAGEFNTTRLTNPRKEISNIITAFNSLADKLAHRDREVRRKTNSLEEVNAELSLEINERKLIEDALQ